VSETLYGKLDLWSFARSAAARKSAGAEVVA
jgi:hypothetical protein